MGRDVPRLPYGIHNHPQEKINPTTYLSNFLGCYMIFLVCVLLFKEGYYMASWPGWTALDIWRAGRDGPRLTYGELAGMNRACHMVSWPGRTTLAIWRAGQDGGQVRARRMASQSGWVKPRPSSGDSDGLGVLVSLFPVSSFVFREFFVKEIGSSNLRTCRITSF
ncbi:hypothetical protein F2Q69_00035518 [Brassica cretica]|uniref:Uncharacterized protein n=1 Tax=Brassica cretica TaxID=69181 RepID=A0A8S9SFW2_BRACR|nr:hypothetical protein F2Q69_00035518 [Brassica cretica]